MIKLLTKEPCEKYDYGCLMANIKLHPDYENLENIEEIINSHGLLLEKDLHITILYGLLNPEKDLDRMLDVLNSIKYLSKIVFNNLCIFGKEDKCLVVKGYCGQFYQLNNLISNNIEIKKSDFSFYDAHCTLVYGDEDKLLALKEELESNIPFVFEFEKTFMLSTNKEIRYLIGE